MAGNVQFILGRAGSGKSRLIQERIVQHLRDDPLGPPIYLLVPAQATFAHERFYALAAGVEGFARLRVVSFENLGEEVIAECGGEALTEVTGAGRQMLLGHLLRVNSDRLSFFRPVARQLGLVRELDRTFSELDRAGRSSGELYESLPEMLSDTAGPEYAALLDKTRDLALLGDAYTKALGEDRLDATRRLEHVLKHLDGCRSLRGARLFVDGFYRFSAFERLFLAKLAALVQETSVALTLDPGEIDHTYDESALFFQTVTTYRQLRAELEKAHAAVAPNLALQTPHRFRSPALTRIEHDWSMPRPSRDQGVDASAVRLIETPDLRAEAEAEAAARQVKDWTLQGYRLRDIAVLCRDLSEMQPLLEAAFREHELPYFMDRRRPAAHHPLVRFVRSLLNVAMHHWPLESVLDLCKCGLAGMSLDEADTLENYVLEHRIRGSSAWTSGQPWTFHGKAPEDDEGVLPPIDEDAQVAERLRRRLAEAIVPLSAALGGDPRPVREYLKALWTCLEEFEVRQRLDEQIAEATAGDRAEEAAEHAQAWEELAGLLDQAAELLGNEAMEAADFVATLEYGLDLLDLAIIPPQADQVVIGDVERTRVLGCRAAIVLGLNDGTFPRSNADATVLSDEERRLLRRNGVDVDPDGKCRQLSERFLAYRAFTTPAERLTLMRSTADGEGRPASVSPYWQHISTLLGIVPQRLERESASEPSGIGTPRQLATVLMRWARSGDTADAAAGGRAPALYQFLAEHRDLDGALGKVRRLSWRALSYRNEARLKPETASALFGDALYTSVSRLESFTACPFRHYAQHVLKLRGRDDGDNVTPRDLGTVYHGVLERLVRGCLQQNLKFIDPGSITPEQIQEITHKVGESLRGRVLLSNACNAYLLKRIETMLHGIIAGQQAVLRRGRFVPLKTELKFGEGQDAELPPLELSTPRGRRLRLYGQIDRVDYAPGTGYAAVIDYKYSRRVLRLDHVTYGLSLQLLLYLLVLQRNGAALADPAPQPAAALYVKLLRGLESKKHPSEGSSPGEPAFDLRVKPRGVIDADILKLLDAEYSGKGWSEAYSIALASDSRPSQSDGNDLIESADLDALMSHVEREVVKLADELMEGLIAVRPYKMGTTTPCPTCDFRTVCRFDTSQDSYLPMPPKRRRQVLEELSAAPPAAEAGE